MSAKNWFKLLFLGLVWGSSYLWIKIALQEVGPFTLVFFRVLFATLGVLVFLFSAKTSLKTQWFWKFALVGFFNVAMPFVLISWAEKSISSGLAAILNSTVPLFTIVLAPIFLKDERLSASRVIGFVLGFAGVLILMSDKLGGEESSAVIGIIAMLIAAVSYAISGIFARKRMSDIPVEAVSFGQMAAAFCFILPAALILEAPLKLPQLPLTWLALLWLGLLGSCVCTLVWYSLLYAVGPTRTSMNSYLLPLVGVMLGAVLLGEEINWHVVVGGVLILVALVIVNSNAARKHFGRVESLEKVEGE